MLRSFERLLRKIEEKNIETLYVLDRNRIFTKKIKNLLIHVPVKVKNIKHVTHLDGLNFDEDMLVIFDRDMLNTNVLEYIKCFDKPNIHILSEDIYTEDEKIVSDEIYEIHWKLNEEKTEGRIFNSDFEWNELTFMLTDLTAYQREIVEDIKENNIISPKKYVEVFIKRYDVLNLLVAINCAIECGYVHFTVLKKEVEQLINNVMDNNNGWCIKK